MEPTFYISSEFELKVYLFVLIELKMAANYITKGFLYILSDILSLITVALCLVQKVPQIRELYTYKSAKGEYRPNEYTILNGIWNVYHVLLIVSLTGISTTSLLLELSSYTVMALYNYTYQYPILTYLEYPILLVQEYILVALVFKYKKMLNQNSFVSIGAYWVIVLLFMYQICPRFLLLMAVVSSHNNCSNILTKIGSLIMKLSNPNSHSAHRLEQPAKYFNYGKY